MTRNYWQSKNIRLRTLEEKDLQMYIDNRTSTDSIREWYEDRILMPSSAEEIKDEFTKARADFSKDDKKILVVETLDDIYVGEICVWHADKHNRWFKYGIFLKEEFRGRGFAKEALIIVLDYYFNELGYNKCSPTVYSYNENSQKFHEKFGFKREGILREEVFTRGKYFDMYCYGMTCSEFNTLYKHFA